MKLQLSWIWVLPIMLIVTLLVTGRFLEDTLWYDEVTTMLFIGGGKFSSIPVTDAVIWVARDGAWPPGYFLLAYVWEFFIDGSVLGHRLVSFWFGLPTIAIMYRLGRSMFGSEQAGIVSAALMGFSAIFVYQFHEARGYTLWVFVSAIQIWMYWLVLNAKIFKTSKGARWGFAFATGAVLYLHYVSLVSVFVLGVYHLLFERKNANFLAILKLGFNGCLLFTPWLAVFFVSYYNKTLTETGNLLATYWSSVIAFSNGMPLILVLVGGFALWRLKKHSALKMLLFWIVGVYIIVAIGNNWANFIHHPRHIMVVLIPIVLLLTYLIDSSLQRFPFVGAFLLLLWIGLGAMNAGQQDFIENIVGQYDIIPAEAMETTIDVAYDCIDEQDRLILAIWPIEGDTWIHNLTMYYHFYRGNFQYTLLDRFEPMDTLELPIVDIPFVDRIPPFIAGAQHIWLFMVTDVNMQEQQEVFEETIASMGYTERDVVVATPILTGSVYYREGVAIEDLHQCIAAL